MPRELPNDILHPTVAPAFSHLSISLQTWKDAHPEYEALVTGAFVFRPSKSSPTKPELLLLQRASTDSYPNVWEPPGGSVDLEDETLMHGLVREVWEETGLRVKNVRDMVWDRNEEERKKVIQTGDDGEVKFQGKRGDWWCKLNFIVDVWSEKELGKTAKEGEVEVDYAVLTDDKEHQDWRWCTREQMEQLPFVSDQGRAIVRHAFTSYEKTLQL